MNTFASAPMSNTLDDKDMEKLLFPLQLSGTVLVDVEGEGAEMSIFVAASSWVTLHTWCAYLERLGPVVPIKQDVTIQVVAEQFFRSERDPYTWAIRRE